MLPDGTDIMAGDAELAISELSEGQAVKTARGWGTLASEELEALGCQEREANLFKLTTSSGKTLRCSPNQTLFARIDQQVKYYSVYLQERSTLGFRLGISYDLIGEFTSPAVYKAEFERGVSTEIIDKIWIIENTTSLEEANFIQKFAAFKYGVPDVAFNAKKREITELGEDFTKMIYENLNTPANALKLLQDSYMQLECPHITLRFLDIYPPVSNAIHFVIFGGPLRPDRQGFSSLIQIGSKTKSFEEPKTNKRHVIKQGNWNLEVTRDHLDEAELFVKTLSHLDNLDIIKKIQIHKKNPYYVLPASHVKRGMIVPVLAENNTIDEETVCRVDIEEYSGKLYAPRVKAARNLVASRWFIGA
jgi:hypothetical protein